MGTRLAITVDEKIKRQSQPDGLRPPSSASVRNPPAPCSRRPPARCCRPPPRTAPAPAGTETVPRSRRTARLGVARILVSEKGARWFEPAARSDHTCCGTSGHGSMMRHGAAPLPAIPPTFRRWPVAVGCRAAAWRRDEDVEGQRLHVEQVGHQASPVQVPIGSRPASGCGSPRLLFATQPQPLPQLQHALVPLCAACCAVSRRCFDAPIRLPSAWS